MQSFAEHATPYEITDEQRRTAPASGGGRGVGLAIAARRAAEGVVDLARYRAAPGEAPLLPDLFPHR